ncbi:MAG TPA: nucleoside phosphorylase [Firmicutes bacterium]|nr:nucleoside phosphorylase [Bacillota bacterium]
MLFFGDYDSEKTAFVNPCDTTEKIDGFPAVAVSTFSADIIDDYVKEHKPPVIARLYTANGSLPVYLAEYKGEKIALFLSRVGAPACAAGLEEIIAMGARKIVLFGCCGVLNEAATKGKIILPSSAVRDEGTSQYYFPPGEEIAADEKCLRTAEEFFRARGVPFVTGKVWTSDAIYRETPGLIAKRKEQGCLGVEMECAAATAVAKFRNIPFLQFLFGADNLDCAEYDMRDLTLYGRNAGGVYMTLAFECGIRL